MSADNIESKSRFELLQEWKKAKYVDDPSPNNSSASILKELSSKNQLNTLKQNPLRAKENTPPFIQGVNRLSASVPVKPVGLKVSQKINENAAMKSISHLSKIGADKSKDGNDDLQKLIEKSLRFTKGNQKQLVDMLQQLSMDNGSQAQISRLKQTISNMQGELIEKDAKLQELRSKWQQSRAADKERQIQVQDYEQKVLSYQQQVDSLLPERDAYKEQVAQLQDSVQQLQGDVDCKCRLIDQYQTNYVPSEVLEELQQAYNEMLVQNEEQELLLSEAAEELEHLTARNNDLRQELIKQECCISESKNEIMEKDLQIKQQLESEKEVEQSSNKECTEVGVQCDRYIDPLVIEAQIAIQEFKSLKFANALVMEQMLQQKQQFQREIGQLKSRCEASRDWKVQFEKSQKQLQDMKAKVAKLQRLLSDQESDCLKKQQENEQLVATIQELKKFIEESADT
ncbi:hypothetical protein MP228_002785 [Amoeboaphelidium protococcarum]|nr:hypothetical protein MP228_002785 [Amoeboaphelidium protococcarum]